MLFEKTLRILKRILKTDLNEDHCLFWTVVMPALFLLSVMSTVLLVESSFHHKDIALGLLLTFGTSFVVSLSIYIDNQ